MKYSYLIIVLSLLMVSCQREEMNVNVLMQEVENGDPMIEVTGSVAGFIVDEQGNPVEDAIVTMGNQTTTTSQFGSFVFIEQKLYADGTYIKVDKPGYFQGSRRFDAIADAQNNIKVRLIQKTEVGNIESGVGGDVEVSTANIKMPAGSYTLEGGAAYTGNVNVFAKYLDPTKEETFEEMPGDLIGVDSEGVTNALATFGMLAVELENDNGQKVNLPEGEKAIISMVVPDALLSVAPATIPLWHFDEDKGIWLEEGEANLENGVYVGEVSHFSFWNCDYPLPLVNIEGLVNLNGQFGQGLKIQVIDNSTGFIGCGHTTTRGYFTGKVPEGVSLTIRVLDPCGDVLHEEEIGPFSEDTQLDLINVNTTLNPVRLYGKVDNCIAAEISDASVVVDFGSTSMIMICDENGEFDFVTPPCQNGTVDIYGIDIANSLISPEAIINFSGDQNVGTLIACEDYVEEGFFIDYDNKNWGDQAIDSTLVGYTYEIDTFTNGTNTLVKFKFTMIDWFIFDPILNLSQYSGEYTYILGGDTADLNGEFQSQGFNVSGTSTYEEINQGGNKLLRFHFSTTDVEEVDPLLFPGDVGEVKIYLTIFLN